jgi:hypothetical protein
MIMHEFETSEPYAGAAAQQLAAGGAAAVTTAVNRQQWDPILRPIDMHTVYAAAGPKGTSVQHLAAVSVIAFR